MIKYFRCLPGLENENTAHLHDAASRGDVNSLRDMLVNCANPNAADAQRMTALHLAAANGHADVVRLLLDFGISGSENTGGFTPAQLTKREDIKEMIHGATGAGMNER